MGRDIKYKAWLPTIKKMTYGHTLDEWLLHFPHVEDFSEDAVWLQYTGLKDNNGREVYEGDICKTTKFIGVVEWRRTQYALMVNENTWTGMMGEIEVIGNIYENPELLEV
jgi:uncharacterized phage protein (TIGR01671 family)